jgi:hypothetical protein
MQWIAIDMILMKQIHVHWVVDTLFILGLVLPPSPNLPFWYDFDEANTCSSSHVGLGLFSPSLFFGCFETL